MHKSLHIRLRAGAIHAAGSLAVAALAACLVFLLWYPWPYRLISGGTELFVLVTGVDVVLGPLLTLTIFDIRKARAELWRDMAVVLALQLAALAYGLHTVYVARPVVLALEGDRFRATPAVAVRTEELSQSLPEFRHLPLTGPLLVNTQTPAAQDEKLEAIMMGIAGADLGTRPKYWRPWDAEARQSALRNSRPAAVLLSKYPEKAAVLRSEAARVGRPLERLSYIPILGRRTDWVALLDTNTGHLAGYAPLDGF